ncbi:MAG: hypothetical protein M0P71_01495 [Melioribacteraceae bacterium]|nr:hypothetical protein [Melioribacteraceae bacterium]
MVNIVDGNIVPFSSILEILNSINKESLIQYMGCVGTQSNQDSTSFQTIELKIVFTTGSGVENGEREGS